MLKEIPILFKSLKGKENIFKEYLLGVKYLQYWTSDCQGVDENNCGLCLTGAMYY